jgi:cold shock CspA family protein
MSTNDAVTSASSTEKMIGCVKWFNNKAGYGFISLIDGENVGKEIFVHHTGIGVNEQQYKYLVQGEYVEFVLSSTEGGQHEFQAVNVTGIKGGKLMCETIYEMKLARTNYKSSNDQEGEVSESSVRPPRSSRPPLEPRTLRRRVGASSEEKDWSLIKGKRKAAPKVSA